MRQFPHKLAIECVDCKLQSRGLKALAHPKVAALDNRVSGHNAVSLPWFLACHRRSFYSDFVAYHGFMVTCTSLVPILPIGLCCGSSYSKVLHLMRCDCWAGTRTPYRGPRFGFPPKLNWSRASVPACTCS